MLVGWWDVCGCGHTKGKTRRLSCVFFLFRFFGCCFFASIKANEQLSKVKRSPDVALPDVESIKINLTQEIQH